MVIIMLSLNKKLKQIQTSIKREVYSASGRNTSLSYNTQNHMNIIVYKKLTFYTFVSSPVTESIINPLTIISSGINGCSIIARTVPFTDFSVSSKPSQPCSKIYTTETNHINGFLLDATCFHVFYHLITIHVTGSTIRMSNNHNFLYT